MVLVLHRRKGKCCQHPGAAMTPDIAWLIELAEKVLAKLDGQKGDPLYSGYGAEEFLRDVLPILRLAQQAQEKLGNYCEQCSDFHKWKHLFGKNPGWSCGRCGGPVAGRFDDCANCGLSGWPEGVKKPTQQAQTPQPNEREELGKELAAIIRKAKTDWSTSGVVFDTTTTDWIVEAILAAGWRKG